MDDLELFHEDVLEAYDAVDKPEGLLSLYVSGVKQLIIDNDYKQSRIDELMLEYCPADMTEEQIKNWESHQRVVEINL